ncbi:hypothetical protein GCM10023204_23730 [Actinomycetospora succinea]
MRWLVVPGSPPLSCRPSRVAQAQPPGPGLPEHAPSVHTSSAPSAAGMSGRGGFVAFVAFADLVRAAPDPAEPAQAACAQRSPERAISSPGETAEAQTPHVVAYLAVIGTPSG